MVEVKDVQWFKRYVIPLLNGYEVKYKFFENGDFGSLDQVEFNSKKLGGQVDFWGLGWLGIFIWDYQNNEELLNILLEPIEINEKEVAFEKLFKLLNAKMQ